MFRSLKSPINVQVEITELCDNTCRHCYNFFRHCGYKHKTLSKEQCDRIVEELKENQVVRGVVTGGEPLIVPQLALHLVRGMRGIGMGVTFNSNLTQLNESVGKELQNLGVESLMTSLIADDPEIHDFVTQKTGSWIQTTSGIKLAVKMGFRVLVNMVLTKWNFHRLRQTGDLVGSLGVDKFGATRACPPGPIAPNFIQNLISIEELRESLDILYQLKEKWGYRVDVFEHYPWCAMVDVKKYKYLARRKCTAGVTSASIGADGQLRPCGHSSMTYGNVLEEGLQKPWSRMMEWRQQRFSQQCRDCRFYRKCTGGCAVDAQNSEHNRDYHMTSGVDVVSTPDKNILIPLDSATELHIPPHVILRKENFGGTIASGSAGVAYIDEQSLVILTSVRNRKRFTISEIVSEFNIETEQAREVLTQLEARHLVKKGGSKP